MTSKAELRLFFDEQKLLLFRPMGRVTGNAAYIVDVVLRAIEVGVLRPVLMAFHAAAADFGCGFVFEAEYFGFVAAALDVGCPRPVARLTAMAFLERGLVVRRAGKSFFVDIFVASLTSLRTHVL